MMDVPDTQEVNSVAMSAIQHILSRQQHQIDSMVYSLKIYKNEAIKEITNSTRVQMAYLPEQLLDMPLETLFTTFQGDIDGAARHIKNSIIRSMQDQENRDIESLMEKITVKQYQQLIKLNNTGVQKKEKFLAPQSIIGNSDKPSTIPHSIFNQTRQMFKKVDKSRSKSPLISNPRKKKNPKAKAFNNRSLSPTNMNQMNKQKHSPFKPKVQLSQIKQQNPLTHKLFENGYKGLNILQIQHEQFLSQNLESLQFLVKEYSQGDSTQSQNYLKCLSTVKQIAQKYSGMKSVNSAQSVSDKEIQQHQDRLQYLVREFKEKVGLDGQLSAEESREVGNEWIRYLSRYYSEREENKSGTERGQQ